LKKYWPSQFLTGITEDERTGANVTYKAPDHHYLESWKQLRAEKKKGIYSRSQPSITPILQVASGARRSFPGLGPANPGPEYYSILADILEELVPCKKQVVQEIFNHWWEQMCFMKEFLENAASGSGAVSFSGDINALRRR